MTRAKRATSKTKRSKQPEESYKMKPMVILIAGVFAVIVLTILMIFVFHFDKMLPSAKVDPRGIDCMPPMSASEQKCLDSGECYCVTY